MSATGFKAFKNVEPVDPNEVEEKSTEVDESVAKFFDENEAM